MKLRAFTILPICILTVVCWGAPSLAQTVISIAKPVTGNGSVLTALTDGLTPINHRFHNPEGTVDVERLWYGPPVGAYFTIDLEQLSSVDAFRIWGDMSPGYGYVIRQFSIALSSDAESYETVIDRQSAYLIGWMGDGLLVELPDTRQARYVRFTVDAIDPEGAGASLSEFEVLSNKSAPLHLTQHPSSVVSRPGAVLSLTATATGSVPLSYQWQFNGTNIVGATNPTITVMNSPGEGSGLYRVLVSGAGFTAASNPAILAVFDIRPSPTGPQILLAGPKGYYLALESRTDFSEGTPWTWWTSVGFGSTPLTRPMPSATDRYFVRAYLVP